MEKHIHRDFNKDKLCLDDEVLFVDRISGLFKEGKIAEFRRYAVGILANREKGGIVTYWRTGEEILKTCPL